MSSFPNRYDPPKTAEEEIASDLDLEEMMEMSEEERDRLLEVEAQKYVQARNAASPAYLYRCDRRQALATCLTSRTIIRTWYVSGEPAPTDHFTRDMLRSAQIRLVRLRAARSSGHARSAVQ